MTEGGGSASAVADTQIWCREWDEISCPICMDHPHNAVLLLCSSHEKGCSPFICDTSHRHSNCLDRFKRPKPDPEPDPREGSPHGLRPPLPSPTSESGSDVQIVRRRNLAGTDGAHSPETGAPEAPVGANDQESSDRYLETMGLQDSDVGSGVMYQGELLKCPLCRGTVLGYRIVKEMRQYLDQKPRACSWESCPFSGNYRELRRHARRVHPSKRPADVDPRRLREWRHLEHEQEIGDVLSALRSTTPNVVVIGDYVIDGGGHRVLPNQEGGGGGGGGSGEGGARSWRTTLLLLELLGSQFGDAPPRSSSRSWRTNRRPGHRNLWGENLLGLQDEDDDEFLGSAGVPVRQRTRSGRRSPWGDDLLGLREEDDEEGFSDGEEAMAPRRRRRFARSQNDADGSER
ncbi:unnamed protein product [Spirodela intermedia]|uniref:Uncharacterized protein n=1 Tax=Spirodela intermedia TaxID=51605 RepID=A0A7I8K3E2_SPIIN|nr:unnamed protein product [Spirodela intermedia]